MALLAIKGHPTRGSEVIAWLEMLGGINNRFKFDGLNEEFIYYICPEYNNDILSAIIPTNQIVFSLEEFEEKFPYKVGGKVIYKDKRREITKMVWEEQTNTIAYKLDDKLYCNVINKLQPYKEENMENNVNYCQMGKITAVCFQDTNYEDKVELQLGDQYEIKEENGKYYAIKKQPKYPKTYEECCSILGCKADHFFTDFSYNGCDVEISDYEDKIDDLLQIFRKLIYCRDAYWKIAGEQMGLDKAWEPNWYDDKQGRHMIMVYENKPYKDMSIVGTNFILVFPTAEMRDTFYENFKELIEACKELL